MRSELLLGVAGRGELGFELDLHESLPSAFYQVFYLEKIFHALNYTYEYIAFA